ncbi:DUF1553 domain-containing protein [Roseibacillus persicicus]|uniref:Cytochrome c domain-containing protein n=1 Tax=Roseibacillus persicicus TaxID=454148 RepID=A0A918TU86_9BACT|nr:DUF1553 domain-containing protein [Roseibacillus persicicus]GHC56821.1 hypothetical protein GCM10007100_24530 [Roseibacillus persicicus]
MRWLFLLSLLCLTSCREKDPWAGDPSVPQTISFNQHIRPLLTRECLQCHGAERADGGLRLDRPSGVASVTSDNSPKKSRLWEKIVENHPVALPNSEQAILWRWIKQGTPTEGHWAALPLTDPSTSLIPPSLKPGEPVTDSELAFLARSLFGREATAAEMAYCKQHQPARGDLIDSMMRHRDFGQNFGTRLLLLSGASPVSPKGPFAPYLRWLETQISNPSFSLNDFFTDSLAGDLISEAGQQGTIATAWVRLPHRAGLDSLAARVAHGLLAIDLTRPDSPNDLWANASETLPLFLPDFPPAARGEIANPPFLPVHTPIQREALKEALTKEPDAWAATETAPETATANFAAWFAEETPAVEIPDLAVAFAFDEAEPGDHSPAPVARLRAPFALAEGVQGMGLAAPAVFEGLPLASAQAFLLSFFLKLSHLPEHPTALFSAQTEQGAPVGFRLDISTRGLEIALLKGSATNCLAVDALTLPQPGHWHHLAIGYDGSRQAKGLQLWIDAKPIPLTIVHDELYGIARAKGGEMRFQFPAMEELAPTVIDELQVYRDVLSEIEIAHLRDGRALLEAVRDEFPREDLLFNYYLRSKSQAARSNRQRAVSASNEVATLQDTALLVPVAEATPSPEVRPTLPFYPLPLTADPDRLGFAQWLFDDRNPITPRVMAARLYQMIHGVNLLPEKDISDPWQVPADPALLDYLARDVLVKDWNLRGILRTILLHPPQASSVINAVEEAI